MTNQLSVDHQQVLQGSQVETCYFGETKDLTNSLNFPINYLFPI